MRKLLFALACLTAVTAGAQYTYRGHEYVDLGCSALWATMNISASDPMQYGAEFAFAETTSRSNFTVTNYKFYDSETESVVFPYPWEEEGVVGNVRYDAARARWGGEWRLPTEGDVTDLFINCDMQDTLISGVRAWIVSSRINNNKIIMPDKYVAEIQDWRGAYFWSGDTYPVVGQAYAMRLSWGYPCADSHPMSYGLPVRPVLSLDYQPVPTHAAVDLVTSDSQFSSNAGFAWSYFSSLLDTVPTSGWTCTLDMVSPPEKPYLQVDLLAPFSGSIEFVMQRFIPLREGQPTRFNVYGANDPEGDFRFLTSINLPLRWPGTWEIADINISNPARYLRFVCTECDGNVTDFGMWHMGEFRLFSGTPSAVRPLKADGHITGRYTVSGQRASEGATGIIIEDGKKILVTEP